MMMSRGTRKQSIVGGSRSSKKSAPKVPSLQDFIAKRDFTGALALLEFKRRNGGDDEETEDEVQTLMWIGYCAFHLGRYERAQEVRGLGVVWQHIYSQADGLGLYAHTQSSHTPPRHLQVYSELMTGNHGKCPPEVPLYLACVYYYMQMYSEAQDAAAEISKDSALKNRVLFHVCHKLGDEHKLMQHHQKLSDTNEDQVRASARAKRALCTHKSIYNKYIISI